MRPIMAFSENSGRHLIVIRHGERCDFVFNTPGGRSWVKRAFTDHGAGSNQSPILILSRYTPFDCNLPRNVPRRSDGHEGFERDTPLTEMGYLQSKLIGRAMRDQGIQIDHIYTSSALRCIQTGVGIIKGYGLGRGENRELTMNIDGGLYEWMQWCRGVKPSTMEHSDLLKIGYPINTSYKPMATVEELRLDETVPQYYQRSNSLVQRILKKHATGTILVIGHASTLEACTRQLCGGEIRSNDDFFAMLRNTPYLASIHAFEHPRRGWELNGSVVPSLTHSNNYSFDPSIYKLEKDEIKKRAEKDFNFAL
ncbi:hypothetical protein PRIPAC_95501 [Pristionchus pacificus]|uniref:Uncharacterized protein n=1 Tax=Pristionchus pacificus TaxID=54126 RepID=A0A2A6D138_PRIPA|nr:hypothetical protein PRIPAC_95501 [Pristionchus pacificus]|eukprot:PDM84090.1 hypothetical protein PRIPAC_34282 [Pristionchus pacificus]